MYMASDPSHLAWIANLRALSEKQHCITVTCTLILLGTHYIQDISVSNSTPGQINISCKFLVKDDLATGFLAVIHSTKDRDNVHYLITQNSNQTSVQGSLNNLQKGTYTVILYTIGEDGLPLRRAAGFPQNLSVLEEGIILHVILTSTYMENRHIKF